MDYWNTKIPSMHCGSDGPTLWQLSFPGKSHPNFPWENSQRDNTSVKKIYIYKNMHLTHPWCSRMTPDWRQNWGRKSAQTHDSPFQTVFLSLVTIPSQTMTTATILQPVWNKRPAWNICTVDVESTHLNRAIHFEEPAFCFEATFGFGLTIDCPGPQ